MNRNFSHRTRPESERRQRLLDGLSTKSKQMEESMKNVNSSGRNALFGAQAPGSSRAGWPDDDIVPANVNLTNDDHRQQQLQLMRGSDTRFCMKYS